MEGREENLPVDGEGKLLLRRAERDARCTSSVLVCRTGREVGVVGVDEEVGHLEKRDERNATFLWKRYVFEEVDLFGSWVTHRGPCVHGELPRTWRGEGVLQMARRHADVGEGAIADGQAPCWC